MNEPKIMGIVNTTPDSFYDGGTSESMTSVIEKVKKQIEEGADIIDIGGYSTKPNAEEVEIEIELERTIPIIEKLIEIYPELIISIDTFRGKVAREAINAGASIINDISGWSIDDDMLLAVKELKVPYILTHIKGTPNTMQIDPVYNDVTLEVNQYFSEKTKVLREAGVIDIILDPGFGFGKTLEHNYQLLSHMDLLGFNEFPMLAGISRKSMIYKLLDKGPNESLNGTSALNMIALQKGAKILRVHDVKEAKEVVKIFKKLDDENKANLGH